MHDDHLHAADLVDFEVAARVCRATLARIVAPPPSVQRRLEKDFARATALAYERVTEVTGLESPAGAPAASVLDRHAWARANLASLRQLLGEVPYPKAIRTGALGTLMRQGSGTEIGLMFSFISGRVLGQYNMIAAEEAPDGIYYVGANIYGLERRHGFAPSEFRLWIALHEVCHHLQFSAVPWMGGYFLDLVRRASALGTASSKTLAEATARAVETLRRGESPLAEGGIAGLLAGTELVSTMREAQALMSLLEGHAEYVMSVTAPERIPGAKRFAAVLEARRAQAKPLARFAQQALGFEAKLRQYQEGHLFVDEVVLHGGAGLLARLWERREHLPTLAEIRNPPVWIDRVGGGPAGAGGAGAAP